MDDAHMLAAARYVPMNPVRAGMVAKPEDWPWSSASAHLAGRDDSVVSVAPLAARIDDFAAFSRPSGRRDREWAPSCVRRPPDDRRGPQSGWPIWNERRIGDWRGSGGDRNPNRTTQVKHRGYFVQCHRNPPKPSPTHSQQTHGSHLVVCVKFCKSVMADGFERGRRGAIHIAQASAPPAAFRRPRL
jgi:hypothetical protein